MLQYSNAKLINDHLTSSCRIYCPVWSMLQELKCYIQRIIRFERYLKCLLVQPLFWGRKHTNPDKWLSSLCLNTSSYCASTTPGGTLLSAQSSRGQEIPSFEFGSPSVKLPPSISCLTLRSYEEEIYTFLLVTGFQVFEDWYFLPPYPSRKLCLLLIIFYLNKD